MLHPLKHSGPAWMGSEETGLVEGVSCHCRGWTGWPLKCPFQPTLFYDYKI